MKERPILFNGSMVLAILEGLKTQTRRPMKRPAGLSDSDFSDLVAWMMRTGSCNVDVAGPADGRQRVVRCPFGKAGDRLWVREAHFIEGTHRGSHDKPNHLRWGAYWGFSGTVSPDGMRIAYHRVGWDCHDSDVRWRPSIHMPRWASRISLEVTRVRLQRLHDITEEDAAAEGFKSRQAFLDGWAGIYGPDNELVWVGDFARVTP